MVHNAFIGDEIKRYILQVWLVGDGLREEEQRNAPKGTKFIPFLQFPVKKIRKDCTYFNTPAMVIPKDLENMHACEVSYNCSPV